ncbi:MAG: DNA translocase FtsK [Lachnospiraceae bacterium]|nr:DNA translocase FtsK [Lachnospiraceae bacterium]
MTTNTGKRSGTTKKNTGRPTGQSKSRTGNGSKTGTRTSKSAPVEEESIFDGDLLIFLTIGICIVLFLCNFGIIGLFGNTVSGIMFGIFGFIAYALPVVTALIVLFSVFNKGNRTVSRKLTAFGVLCFLFMIMCDMATGTINTDLQIDIPGIYSRCSADRKGGGVLGAIPAYYLEKLLGSTGTILFLIVAVIICVVIIAGKSLIRGLKEQGQMIYDEGMEDRRSRNLEREELIREKQKQRSERLAKKRELNDARELEKQLRAEEKENEQILRMDKKSKGVTFNTTIEKEIVHSELDDVPGGKDEHLIKVADEDVFERKRSSSAALHENLAGEGSDAIREIVPENENDVDSYDYNYDIGSENDHLESMAQKSEPVHEIHSPEESYTTEYGNSLGHTGSGVRPAARKTTSVSEGTKGSAEENSAKPAPVPKKASQTTSYKFPPISLLTPGSSSGRSNGEKELKETAERLTMTLETFGVKAKITDVSRGPAVTRYELQPELGVKVSKIVGLSDDLKLALAATDIRIEAPIPGKSAVGIEVPNKENEAVAFRELIESKNFKDSKASLPFAVGKDIGGQIIIHDIAKMPHVLIAGATGSGKSVCINTIIMSILYKCRPEDVRLIMIDPKVVELSVYNDIPHLLLPVVTDPKKAAGALHWAVKEMTDRYAKFAETSVRDLKGYNAQITDPSEKLPHILIIVDELADLMMVAPGEVEESICRLAQLARACGIHLVIATQRPSVDVITGLIKANMPSRIAFAVSSGVDSRTILDMVGAEKLLGKGDMLFYPQGLPKPLRVQGAYVPDSDVNKVTSFFKDLAYVPGGSADISEQVDSIGAASGTSSDNTGNASGSEYDEYFAQAGRFIIDKEKASIGALQRLLKIGFNRAARIMDQLAETGVVGEEQGTKPREILMNEVQFEELLNSLGIQ